MEHDTVWQVLDTLRVLALFVVPAAYALGSFISD
jgi:hypothetical protein